MSLHFSEAKWHSDASGSWLSLKVDSLAEAAEQAEQIQKGKDYIADLKLYKQKRSLDANAYFWVLCGKLAEKIRCSRTAVYREMVREIGGNYTVVCIKENAVEKLRAGWQQNGIGWISDVMESKLPGCSNVILYYGSSTYDTAQMSRLLDLTIDACKEQNIDTATPAEIQRMKEGWK